MKKASACRIVFVTCAHSMQAKLIARTLVEKRLAACVNIVSSKVESIYRWKGNVERALEYLLIIKTTAKRLAELEKEVKRLHSYEVPELLVLPVSAGSREYLHWMRDSVEPA
jgi:periplasmic divalent cation tolerance protein